MMATISANMSTSMAIGHLVDPSGHHNVIRMEIRKNDGQTDGVGVKEAFASKNNPIYFYKTQTELKMSRI